MIVLLGGCGTKEVEIPEDNYLITGDADFDNPQFVKRTLYEQYSQWKGTHYRSGGLNRNGIDCSGLVYITFKHRFGIILPRTTEEMVRLGKTVSRGQWRAGDLIFFKTGIMDRHVGVYIDQGQFLHASSSQGVIISELTNSYWSSTYWKAKRIGT
ncbi:MAG: C40 family peptidase [Desulfamplus sp.]|nr:C40 family peptidase [Desulfamplus sp.]